MFWRAERFFCKVGGSLEAWKSCMEALDETYWNFDFKCLIFFPNFKYFKFLFIKSLELDPDLELPKKTKKPGSWSVFSEYGYETLLMTARYHLASFPRHTQ